MLKNRNNTHTTANAYQHHMKHIFRSWPAAILLAALFLTSCEEDTGTLGLFPQQDAVSSSSADFNVLSNDLLNDVVLAGSSTCYLGKVIDPETDEAITASFAAQFHTFENFTFPSRTNIIPAADGLLCDSVEIRLFIKDTFGDKNNPMKVEVWPLSADEDKLLKETESLYTNTDLWQFADTQKGPVATKAFTATDYIISDAQRSSTSYTSNVRIVLPREVGEEIMQAYFTNPKFFRDSYSFIRNVCPGFLFRTTGGSGTMLNVEVSTMNINFRYTDPAYPDSVMQGLCRFAATPEVIQSTQFESSNLAGLIDNEEYTMLKTPAGICTELVLPINDIYRGHENDSISRASLTMLRINNQDENAQNDSYALGIPANLLLVRKQHLKTFFENHQVADMQQSFTTPFLPIYNSYDFSNLSRLVSYIQHEKVAGMKAQGMTEAQWEAAHPDWNRVVLVPVTISSTTDANGISTLVSVRQDLSLCSTKLVRGTEASPIKMQVFYSRFAGN